MFLELEALGQRFTNLLEQAIRLFPIDSMIMPYRQHDLSNLVAVLVLVLVQAQTDVGADLSSPTTFDFEPGLDGSSSRTGDLVVERDWGGCKAEVDVGRGGIDGLYHVAFPVAAEEVADGEMR